MAFAVKIIIDLYCSSFITARDNFSKLVKLTDNIAKLFV